MGQPSQYGPRSVHSRRSSLSRMNAPLRVATVNSVFDIGSLLAFAGRSRVSPIGDVLRVETPTAEESHRSAIQRLSGLEQRLQVAEDEHPTGAGNALGRLRRALELVVDDGQERGPVFLLLDLPRDTARLLRGKLGVVGRCPAVDEPSRRVGFEDLLLPLHLSNGGDPPSVAELDPDAVEVALRELGLRDRVPDLLRGG